MSLSSFGKEVEGQKFTEPRPVSSYHDMRMYKPGCPYRRDQGESTYASISEMMRMGFKPYCSYYDTDCNNLNINPKECMDCGRGIDKDSIRCPICQYTLDDSIISRGHHNFTFSSGTHVKEPHKVSLTTNLCSHREDLVVNFLKQYNPDIPVHMHIGAYRPQVFLSVTQRFHLVSDYRKLWLLWMELVVNPAIGSVNPLTVRINGT